MLFKLMQAQMQVWSHCFWLHVHNTSVILDILSSPLMNFIDRTWISIIYFRSYYKDKDLLSGREKLVNFSPWLLGLPTLQRNLTSSRPSSASRRTDYPAFGRRLQQYGPAFWASEFQRNSEIDEPSTRHDSLRLRQPDKGSNKRTFICLHFL